MPRPKEHIPNGVFTVYPQRVRRASGHGGSLSISDKHNFGHEGEVLTVVDDHGTRHRLHLIPGLSKVDPSVGRDLFTGPQGVELTVTKKTFKPTRTEFKAVLEVKPRQSVVSES